MAVKVLSAVEQDGAYSNLELNRRLKEADLSPADAGLATELVYGTIARLNTLDYFLERYVAKGVSKLQPWVRSLLRISVYQMIYLDRIPEHAVVSEAVNLAKKLGHQGISGMVNGVLRNMIRNGDDFVFQNICPLPNVFHWSIPTRYGWLNAGLPSTAKRQRKRSVVRIMSRQR